MAQEYFERHERSLEHFWVRSRHRCYRSPRLHGVLVGQPLIERLIENRPWGMCEFTLTDPRGNNIRVGQNVPGDDHSPED